MKQDVEVIKAKSTIRERAKGKVADRMRVAAYCRVSTDSELLLVVLSSVAQQKEENISANVKKGLKMKMQRGELVGFQGCLGYDYDKETKSISVNEEEAKLYATSLTATLRVQEEVLLLVS